MPIHIEEMTSDVTVVEGDLPLSEQQIEKLVQIVLARLARKEREAKSFREATAIRRRSAPSSRIGE